ncbi:DNA polymerase alpha/epsilon subunit B-domain-containing protein [Entophlyctis helioformis]|nr:DNA polymerase alpha/epsilon subunit B-domain-containing protein [Entophlyctis helioformis]
MSPTPVSSRQPEPSPALAQSSLRSEQQSDNSTSSEQLLRASARLDRLDSDRFTLTERTYTHQYAALYFTRLNRLRPRVQAAANRRWASLSKPPPFVRILGLVPGVVSCVIGTIYVDMPLKPNVLELVTRKDSLVSDKDKVLLEDESGRIILTGDLVQRANLMTGVIAAFLGSENDSGEFQVADICYADFSPQAPLPHLSASNSNTHGPWIALLSGLEIGSTDSFDIRYMMLVDYLTGESGSEEDMQTAQGICRVVLCGDTLAKMKPMHDARNPKITGSTSTNTGGIGGQAIAFDGSAVDAADALLLSLAASMPVDVVPGPSDPTTAFLPQQPIHSSIFQRACRVSSLSMLTNPTTFAVEDTSFVVDSGQPLEDMHRMTSSARGIDLASHVLKWGHLAPTAPDTIWCHPFQMDDPLVLDTRPHVFVVGNQPRFDTRLVHMPRSGTGHASNGRDDPMDGEQENAKEDTETTRVILVPRFAETGVLVLVNTATLECKTVEFGCAV